MIRINVLTDHRGTGHRGSDHQVLSAVRLAQLEDEIARVYWWEQVARRWAWPVATLVVVGAALWEIFRW